MGKVVARTLLGLACVVLCVLQSCVQVAADKTATNNGFFLWNGFDYEWLKEVPLLDATYGHRLGDFGSYLDKEDHTINDNGEWVGTAEANMIFTPGPDGDYANPMIAYTGAYSPYVKLGEPQEYKFPFTDNCTNTGYSDTLVAKSDFSIPISLDIPEDDNGNLYDQYDAILRGFRLIMTCDDAKQPNGTVCKNGDSIWPTKLNLDIASCDRVGFTQISCILDISVWRGVTPAGVPQDFNYAVDYTVHVYLSTIAANSSHANFMRSRDLVEMDGFIKNGPMSASDSVSSVTDINYNVGLVALSGFGFQLEVTNGIANKGRDVNSFVFNVADNQYEVEQTSNGKYNATARYDYNMGLKISAANWPEHAQYWHRTSLLQLVATNTTEGTSDGTSVVDKQTVQGSVCQSHLTFQCALQGRFDHTSSTKKIEVSAQVA